ncbi:response regulator receiver protein [Pedosphaera parvula Ellin514]|uniref:Response regulator receiver protein n=2 Tax=Pedosphaera TaxID=1032526 RepID=B9XE84_PEDPL|nr:response regulator receiver protein [Pedosphaera parvula Ellin514]
MSVQGKLPLILMAEDDSDDRLLAKDAATECGLGVDVRFVEDGAELMDYLKRRGKYIDPAAAARPDLVIIDLNMPRKDGREALKEIKLDAELKKIPVVIFTTSRADTDISLAYQLGANSFITKPVAFDALVNVMKAIKAYWFDAVILPINK